MAELAQRAADNKINEIPKARELSIHHKLAVLHHNKTTCTIKADKSGFPTV
jgi:hypothetical protein